MIKMYTSQNNILIPDAVIPRHVLNGFPISDHTCYMLQSRVADQTYVGYTIDFNHRIRQHNGEIVGGAKKTMKYRPWAPICKIKGFYEGSSALRFEYRLQHPGRKKRTNEDSITFALQILADIITNGDGSIEKGNKIAWPHLTIEWCISGYGIEHPNVTNVYN